MKQPDNGHARRRPSNGGDRLRLEITLRRMVPLDAVVFRIKDHAASVEDLLDGEAFCSAVVTPYWTRDGARVYDVRLRLVSDAGSGEVHQTAPDLFATVDAAFEALRGTLRPRGDVSRRSAAPLPGGEFGREHDREP